MLFLLSLLTTNALAIDYMPAARKAAEATYHATIRPDVIKIEKILRPTTVGKVLSAGLFSYRCIRRKEFVWKKALSSSIHSTAIVNQHSGQISFTYNY